jgi:hypothetical protein
MLGIVEYPSVRTRALPLPDSAHSEAREKYRALFESDIMGIAVSDLDEQILEANDAFLSLIGYSRDELRAGYVTWSRITPTSYAALDRRKVRELLRHGVIAPFEKHYIRKDGRHVPVLVGAARMQLSVPLSVCFALDISERKALEIKKDEFIGTVSHELQTPLAVLKMQVGLLRDQVRENARRALVERSVEDIEEQVGRLSLLISDLLNLARYARDPSLGHRETLDVRACVKKVVEDARLVSGRQIRFKTGRGSAIAFGSERRVAQVITNLLMNALRYSPDTSHVVVSLRTLEGKASISVQDFGLGIAEDQLQKIFERFYRVEHAGDYARGASGIGLYVASEIAKAGGGTIEVTSTLGKGSTFTLVMPLAHAEPRVTSSGERSRAPDPRRHQS